MPISKKEQFDVLVVMENKKMPSLDGISIEFYKQHKGTLDNDFYIMIQSTIQARRFPSGFTQGLLLLILKRGDRCALIN